ncbi:MAG: bifunctional glutamate N-acetyltransferase/amino-acid acetyltransferase ArgJ [Planctomycetes bacterium]|nr:bifunctional glutamate N-acetyltransferase/amino-acid acetyltransferase ArgJ [Planctomycetota bacterium]
MNGLPPMPERVVLPAGFRAAGIHCGLKPGGKFDLGLLLADAAVPAAALFTRNRLNGAHVTVCRRHLRASKGMVRAVLVNAKNANCATGEQGVEDAVACCAEVARRIDCPVEQVLMISTGVIGAMLPRQRIVAGLDELIERASVDGGRDFANAIMTTDTYPKALDAARDAVHVAGFAKGSGMIHPDMATMLGFLLADGSFADVESGQAALRRIADRTLHRVTIDGDTSPNDTLLLLHGGAATEPGALEDLLTDVATNLARHIAADGEGATRLVTVEVRGAPDPAAAALVGRVIATSPLVKTAIAGRDPNWGRILAAAGRAGVTFLPEQSKVWVGDVAVYTDGVPQPQNEPAASTHLREQTSVRIGIDLGAGTAEADVWTCDFTADYVQINADYRS